MPANIDAFNAVTLDILGMLYGLHPRKGDFGDADLSEGTREILANLPGQSRVPFWWEVGLWLEKEGFVRIGMRPMSGEYLGHMDLTSKGLAALSATPSSLEGKEPIGDRILSTMGKAGGEVRSAAIGELIGAIFAGALKSFS
jgi:hypothetical protein